MNFIIKKATLSDAESIRNVIDTVYEKMEHKEWYMTDNAEYTYHLLADGAGMGYLAIKEQSQEIAGVFMVEFPGDTEENMGNDIGLTKEQRLRTAHMDSAAVLPKYRGYHLQYRLMQAAEQDLRKMGYEYLMCTVHPENHFSKANVLKQGYQVMVTKEKYGGYLREVLCKKL